MMLAERGVTNVTEIDSIFFIVLFVFTNVTVIDSISFLYCSSLPR